MKYTKNLNLPIYDNPYQDKFDLSEWNEANEAIDSTYGELKVLKDEIASVNPNVEIIDARCGEKTLGDKIRNIDTSINNIIDKNDFNIYVDSKYGLDTNDGINNPVKTVLKAIRIITDKGSSSLFNKVNINIKGNGDMFPYSGVSWYDIPQFKSPLNFIGDVDSNGEPTTIFKYDGVNQFGIRIEPVRGNEIWFENLTFKDFSVGFNGYGILLKNHGYCRVTNCIAYNCDIGFAGVNNTTTNFLNCKVDTCNTGFRNIYNGAMATSTGCEATNCYYGYFLSRNSVGHCDYTLLENNTYGCYVEMSSRLATIDAIFRNNNTGIQLEGNALWTDDADDIFENNEKDVVNMGNSQDLRVAMNSRTDWTLFTKIGSEITNKTVSGSGNVEVYRSSPSIEVLKNRYFLNPRAKVKVEVFGNMKGNGTRKILVEFVQLDNNNNSVGSSLVKCEISSTKSRESSTSFCSTFEFVFNKENKEYHRFATLNTNGYAVSTNQESENKIVSYVATGVSNTVFENKNQIRIHVQNTDSSDEVIIHKINCIIG